MHTMKGSQYKEGGGHLVQVDGRLGKHVSLLNKMTVKEQLGR